MSKITYNVHEELHKRAKPSPMSEIQLEKNRLIQMREDILREGLLYIIINNIGTPSISPAAKNIIIRHIVSGIDERIDQIEKSQKIMHSEINIKETEM